MQKAIGGYFELELPLLDTSKEYHNGAIALNSARNAFEYVLRAKKYKKVFLPYYTCDVMLEPIQKLALQVEFYSVDEQLNPIFNRQVSDDEVFVYTNYYGIKQHTVKEVCKRIKNVIVDNAQAFFDKPIKGVDTIYSARKFVGVPDGAYLYTDTVLEQDLKRDVSFCRTSHLLKRIECGAEAGYEDFKSNDDSLIGQPILQMSELTTNLLRRIDYEQIICKRKENFVYLHSFLEGENSLLFDTVTPAMVYPFLTKNGAELRNKLIKNKIFVARYWPGIELNLVENLIPLPIDQRYTLADMTQIINIIQK